MYMEKTMGSMRQWARTCPPAGHLGARSLGSPSGAIMAAQTSTTSSWRLAEELQATRVEREGLGSVDSRNRTVEVVLQYRWGEVHNILLWKGSPHFLSGGPPPHTPTRFEMPAARGKMSLNARD